MAFPDNMKFQVWWVPQMPMKAFCFDVPDPETGKLLCDALGRYDAFQYENRIKPDYCNAGGVVYQHPTLTGDEWNDWPDDADELAELMRELAESA